MLMKKKNKIKTEENEELESLGIYKDDDEYDEEDNDEKESWRDFG
jgi:hypothetical protein